MRIGIVGVGRMGGNIARRLAANAHQCIVVDIDTEEAMALAAVEERIGAVNDLPQLVQELDPPRWIWVMVPAGDATENVVRELGGLLGSGDVIIDGGNTFYEDDIKRAHELSASGIRYVDVGTSGGVWGLTRGHCLMIGGDPKVVESLTPIFEALSPGLQERFVRPTESRKTGATTAERGYFHCGPTGSGHFVKMVHNAIEYGMMQAYAEGFELLAAAGQGSPGYQLALEEIAELWRRGSVIPSWLLDLAAEALAADPTLRNASASVADSGEGRWALQTAVELGVPVPALSGAVMARFRSRSEERFGSRLLSSLRKGFGGHT